MSFGEIVQIGKLSVMRFFLRKPYGIAYFKIGKFFFNKIVRFDKETIRTQNGIWIFDKNLIYVDKGFTSAVKQEVMDEKPTEEEIKAAIASGNLESLTKGKKQAFKQEHFLGWKSGFPIIFLDQDNMQPMGFNDANNTSPTNPRNIQSILNKEISAFEAELMRKQRDKLEKLLYVAVALSAVAAILIYMQWQDIGLIKEMVAKIPITTTGLNG